MLPFLKLKQAPVSGIIIKRRESDPAPEGSLDAQNAKAADEDSDAGIETCAYALISAVHAQDTKAVAQALRDIFTILDAQPHEEGEHTNEDKPSDSTLNTFKYQNVKAAGKDNA